MPSTFGNQASSMGIDTFIGSIRDLLRPNLFLVELSTYGSGGSGSGSFAPNGFKFHCHASSIPKSEIPAVPVAFMGREIQIAGSGRPSFGSWQVTVYNDIDFQMRKFFEEWSARINYHQANTGYNRIVDYYADADVLQLDQKGNVIANYTMKGIFPSEVGEISLAWQGGGNTVETFSVTFAVGTYWGNSSANVEG